MPEIESTLTYSLNYLHALWASPIREPSNALAKFFGKDSEASTALAAYRKACAGNNAVEATKHLSVIRDLLLKP